MTMQQEIARLQLGDEEHHIKALFHGLVDTVFANHTLVAPRETEPEPADPRRLARAIYASRQQRSKLLPAELLGEPAWDMLLDLYSTDDAEEHGTSTKSVCHAANVPYSTAWRVLTLLESAELVERFGDEQDKRLNLVRLTERGAQAVEQCMLNVGARLATP